MALTQCSECGADISARAVLCPQCGAPGPGRMGMYEYRSSRTWRGLPLLHVVKGPPIDLVTGKLRVAKGVIAIGNVAVGIIAIGGAAIGVLSLGGLSLGLLALGGSAIGLLAAFGGMAIGGLAVGGCAIGGVAIGGAAIGYYALGGAAAGIHPLGGNIRDPQAVEFFRQFLGGLVDRVGRR